MSSLGSTHSDALLFRQASPRQDDVILTSRRTLSSPGRCHPHQQRAIRFVPYPVIGGFLGATGWLIVVGGTQVTTGQPVTIDGAAVLLSSAAGAKLLAATAVALALFLGRHCLRSSFTLPGLLLAGVMAVHLALVAFGISLAEAQTSGWMFTPQSHVGLASPWHGD